MIILSRKPGEKIVIGPDIVLTILETQSNRVRFSIEAPPHTTIHRTESPHAKPSGFPKIPSVINITFPE